jgi:hypothetical protein
MKIGDLVRWHFTADGIKQNRVGVVFEISKKGACARAFFGEEVISWFFIKDLEVIDCGN